MSELDRIARRPEWTQHAECRGLPIDLFFQSGSQVSALAVCSDCPVQEECRVAAIDEERSTDLRFIMGVRGGLTAKQRREVIRRIPKPAPPREVQQCPSSAAYTRHLRNGELPCEGCKRAHADYKAQRKALSHNRSNVIQMRRPA